jgi:hypothetical protein
MIIRFFSTTLFSDGRCDLPPTRVLILEAAKMSTRSVSTTPFSDGTCDPPPTRVLK